MTPTKSLAAQLLAAYWLIRAKEYTGTPLQQLEAFASDKSYDFAPGVFIEAASRITDGDIEGWVIVLCFMGHPHAIWNFMLDAMAFASSEDHLIKIACGLAEHILAHYGSLMPMFEKQAAADPKFERMLTGVWRHRMSDSVWQRMRTLHTAAPTPLSTMIPLEHGVEYMAKGMQPKDRQKADKGKYYLDEKGGWQKRRLKQI